MVTFSTLTICALATYRLTRLITIEEGPFELAQKLRNAVTPADHTTWVSRGMACPWCLSFWIGPLTLYATRYDLGYVVVGGLAVSALVGLLVTCSGYLQYQFERYLKVRR